MKTIKSIGVFSAAKTGAAIYGCLGLVIVPMEMLLGVADIRIPGHLEPGLGILGQVAWHAGRAATSVLAAAISVSGYVVCGFVMGAFAAFIYNVVARRFGGIEVEVELAPEVP